MALQALRASQLAPGKVYVIGGYVNRTGRKRVLDSDKSAFQGVRTGDGNYYATLAEVKNSTGKRNMSELESINARLVFVSKDGDCGGTYTWEAYIFRGRWVFGTSADRLFIAKEV